MKKYMTLDSITRDVDKNAEVKDLNAAVIEAIGNVNTAIATNDHQLIDTTKDAAKKAVEAYNAERKRQIYAVIRGTDNPILTALTIGKIEEMRFTVKKTKAGEVADTSWSEDTIDIVEIEDAFGGKISHNGQWRYWAEKLTLLFVQAVAGDIEYGNRKDIIGGINISKEAQGCDIGVTTVSTTNVTRELQYVLDGLIFHDNGKGENQYKVYKKDARYVEMSMTSRKRRMTIATGKGSLMRKLVTDVAHRIVTNGQYDLEYDQIKKK